MKIGRNDPCPCGSGKKYKRCCLPKDELLAREAAQHEELFVDEDPDDVGFDEDDGSDQPYDVDEDFVFDVGAITRIRYRRGFVRHLSDLEKGRGPDAVEWVAPHIPEALLDIIEHEQLDALDGEWGDPKAGRPIQVDVIDLEAGDTFVSIEVFNRAILLAQADSDEIQRIHRVCEALHAAAAEIPPYTDSGVTASGVAAALDDRSVAAQRADIASLLKQHRKQGGTCALCGALVSRTTAARHFVDCAPAHDASSGKETRLVQLRVTDRRVSCVLARCRGQGGCEARGARLLFTWHLGGMLRPLEPVRDWQCRVLLP